MCRRASDGLWVGTVSLGVDRKTGRRKRRVVYGRTQREVVNELKAIRGEVDAGGSGERSKTTVSEWVEAWLERDVRPNVSYNTFAQFESAWRLHANPLVGSERLQAFSPDSVAKAYSRLRKDGVGGRTIQVVAQVMRSAFDAAIQHERFNRANPWRGVKVPRHLSKEIRVLDSGETKRFAATARGDRFEALWIVLLTGGLRIGEALGLEWTDVDLITGRVELRQQSIEIHGVPTIGPLKTRSSRRVISLGNTAIDALRQRRKITNQEGHSSPYVFTTQTGRLLSRSNLRLRHFIPICEKAGLKGLTPHGLRHSMTSHAIAAGLSPVVVAARLGHASTQMTLDRYGHVLPGQQREAAAVLESHLGLK